MDFSLFPQLIVNSLITGSLYALVSAGLSLNYGLLRVLNFAHGHMMMVGAYAFYFFSQEQGFSLFNSSIGTVGIAAVLATFTLLIFIRPFTKFSYQLTLVTTLALGTILESLVSLFFGVNVKSLMGYSGESIEFGSVYITPIQIGIILSAVVVLGAVAYLVHATAVGRMIRAVRESPSAAESLGISERKVTGGVFLLATVLACFAGVMVGVETNLQPTMGNAYTMKAFAAMILGGLGNVWGTVFGAYLLGFIENFSIGLDFWGVSLPTGYKDAFAFVIILLVLLVRPQGLFGSKARGV
jgi:branched-chain amino acid transport system permease protein